MASPTYVVTVAKKDKSFVELEVRCTQDEYIDLWPTLLLRVLSDAPSSPISGERVYDDERYEALAERWLGDLELVKLKNLGKAGKAAGVFRVHARDAGLIAGLKKGQSWESYHYSTDRISLVGLCSLDAGKKVALGKSSGVIEIGNLKDDFSPKIWLNHPGLVALAASASHLASAGRDIVRVWSLDGELAATIEAPGVTSVALSPNGKTLLFGTRDGVLVKSETLGEKITGWKSLAGPILAVQVDDDGTAFMGGGDGHVRTYGPDGALRDDWDASVGPIVALSAEPSRLVAAGASGAAAVREGARRFELRHTLERQILFHALHDLPEGRLLLQDWRSLWVYDPKTSELSCLLDERVDHADVCGTRIVASNDSISSKGRLWVVDAAAKTEKPWTRSLPPLGLHRNQMIHPRRTARFSPNGQRFLLPVYSSDGRGNYVEVQEVGAISGAKLVSPKPGYDFTTDACFLDDSRVLVGYGNHPAVLFGIDGSVLEILPEKVEVFTISSGRLVTSQGSKITCWSADLKPVETFDARVPWCVNQLDLSKEGRHLLFGAADRREILDLESQTRWEIPHPGGIGAAFFGARRFVATVSKHDAQAKAVMIWDLETREAITTIPVSEHPYDVRFSEDEARLFVAFPWHVGIFDREGKLVSELRGPAPPPQDVPLTGVLLLPKGRVLGVAKDAGSCPLWQGETRAGAVQSGGRIERAALSSDGKKVIVGAIGSVAMRWI